MTTKKELIERHTSVLPFVPSEWEYGSNHGYKVDMRMCQIKQLKYDFDWEEEALSAPVRATVINTPEKILVLDVSLNELTEIAHENLAMMPQLRVLDASLNRIKRFLGVEVLRYLYHLNLSHNFITKIEGLKECRLLTELDLSMNQIEDISYLPPLSNLSVLKINNNRLEKLNGIQALSHLKELHCQRNKITDLIPMSSTRRLVYLNASDNLIDNLRATVDVLKPMHSLQSVSLFGNPIDQEHNYHAEMMHSTSITGLDNVNIKPVRRNTNIVNNPKLFTIKDAAKQAFMDQLKDRRFRMQQSVEFLQQRIQNLQEEFKEYEEKVFQNMDACAVYLDGLVPDQLEKYDTNILRERIESPAARPWEQGPYIPLSTPGLYMKPEQPSLSNPRRPHKKGDYTGITDPDEVLRHAYNELSVQYPGASAKSPSW